MIPIRVKKKEKDQRTSATEQAQGEQNNIDKRQADEGNKEKSEENEKLEQTNISEEGTRKTKKRRQNSNTKS